MRSILVSIMSLMVLVALTQAVQAQGNSKALGKALRKSGTGLKSKSLGRASKNIARTKGLSQSAKSISRSSKSLSRASQPLSRTGRQLGRANRLPNTDGAATRTVGLPNALERQRNNAQRQFDHHLAEAERLRQLAADTGNQELVAQADLIEGQAQQRFNDRTARIDEFQTRHNLAAIANPATPEAGPDVPLIDSGPLTPGTTAAFANPASAAGEVASVPAERTQPRILTTPARTPTRKPTFGERVRGLFPFLKKD
jgi:hypothetical protein